MLIISFSLREMKWCCCLVSQLCPTLCNPMNCSMPSFPSLSFTISWSLLKLMSIESMMPPNHLILCHLLLLLPSVFPSIKVFSNEFFTSGGQRIGASASASVFPKNIQDWFPLGLTGLISLQSKGLSRISPTPQFESINSWALRLLYGPTLTSMHDYWKNHSFNYMDLCWQDNVSAF